MASVLPRIRDAPDTESTPGKGDGDSDGQVDTAGETLSGEEGDATCSRAGPNAVIKATQP